MNPYNVITHTCTGMPVHTVTTTLAHISVVASATAKVSCAVDAVMYDFATNANLASKTHVKIASMLFKHTDVISDTRQPACMQSTKGKF